MIPTVHYNMGGIPANFHGEVVTSDGKPDTVIPGLMAVGEAACVSVHGANRLGSNSLLDLVMFGRAAALRCAATVKAGTPHSSIPKDSEDKSLALLDKLRNAKGSQTTAKIRLDMQKTMQAHAAVFRTSKSLDEGMGKIKRDRRVLQRRGGRRPLDDLEFRPHRNAGTRQPARPGAGDDGLGAEPQGIARRPCARGFSGSR